MSDVVITTAQARTIHRLAATYPGEDLTIYPPIAGAVGVQVGEDLPLIVNADGRIVGERS